MAISFRLNADSDLMKHRCLGCLAWLMAAAERSTAKKRQAIVTDPKGLALPRVRKAKRFVRIRHYGFLSPCNREILRSIQQQLNVPPVPLPCLVSLLTSFEVWTSTLFYI